MPVEIIGEFGTPGGNSACLQGEGEMAITHIKRTCGDPPPEMELEIIWREHELGDYPIIALTWEDAMRGAPWDYVARCEEALTANGNGGELPQGWPNLSVSPEEKDESRNSQSRQEPSLLETTEPIPTTSTDPETVQSKPVRAKRSVAPSSEKLKDMSSPSKCIH